MTETQLNGSGSGNATTVAYFVTDHGYGHATRAAAVMGAMSREAPGIRFEIFTTAPRWLFEGRQPLQYRYHRLKTDVGLVQSSPFEVDLQATVRQLGTTLPFDPGQVTETAALLKDIDTRIVICDIAPIGIDIAEKAGLPSVLVENFTWDWIYAGYRCIENQPGLPSDQPVRRPGPSRPGHIPVRKHGVALHGRVGRAKKLPMAAARHPRYGICHSRR